MFEIGNSLREARLRQGLDFPEIEQATKIRGKYLRSLEEEQFDVLPAQTYVKGFLRSYADYLGLDGQLYVDEFNSRYVRGELDEEADSSRYAPAGWPGPARGGGLQGKAVVLTVAVIAGLTLFVFAAWKWGGTDNSAPARPEPPAGEPPRSQPPISSSRRSPAAPTSRSSGARGKEGDLPGDARERAPADLRRAASLALRLRARESAPSLNGKPQVVPGPAPARAGGSR